MPKRKVTSPQVADKNPSCYVEPSSSKRRVTETEEDSEIHNQRQRERDRRRRNAETQEERQQRLKSQRERQRKNRNEETEEHREERLNSQRERYRQRINEETFEEREQRLNSDIERNRQRRNAETQDERQQRLKSQKERQRKNRNEETEEHREERLNSQRETYRQRINEETFEEREQRLNSDRERNRQRRNEETFEEREQRLNSQRERYRQNRIEETLGHREQQHLNSQREMQRYNRSEGTEAERVELLHHQNMRNNLSLMQNLSADVGHMTKICPHCRAHLFHGETANFCCMKGKVQLQNLQPLPPEIHHLFSSDEPIANEFRKNIRQYNCLFQMTSFAAKEISHRNGWNPSVVIQGQVHHYIGSLIPDPEEQAQYIQIYFLDSQDSIEIRLKILQNVTIQRNIVELLENILRQHNQYILTLRHAKEEIRNIPNAAIEIDPDKRPNQEHERRFNKQIANEVGIIIQNNNEPRSSSRHIVLTHRGGQLQTISESHRSYDPLQYVLFFPSGEDGWHQQMQMTNNKKLTAMRYYAHRIMVHENEFNHLLRGGRLLQQFLVDMAAKIEAERLNYIRLNQSTLRSTTYRGFVDALNDNDDFSNVGRRIILSSTFVGGPRYMMERCQDAMMYVRRYGNATFFITMTCNPNWPEIKEHLFFNQQPNDRPDLIARVFDLKRKLFIKYLTGTQGLFGKCIAYVLSVEYQKRGLPHLHCLLWMDENSKPRPQEYDRFVQAEIPNPNEDFQGHQLVLQHMIHGPYCTNKSPCWKDGRCSKRYPKPYSVHTRCGEDSYPVYRRRSPEMGGHHGHKEGRPRQIITNEWVVPHNLQLLKIFNCHLNVEICSSVQSIKYVIKYTMKGSDQLCFGVNREDEVAQYLTGRYIGPSEAVSTILGFPIHNREPAVIRLQVHLPEQQQVFYQENETIQHNNNMTKTTLTEFFDLCVRDPFAKTLYYVDIPRFYVWNNKRWQRRKSGMRVQLHPHIFEANVIGRVYTVSPKIGDLYYMRLLLHHVKGPVSFDELKTVHGVILPSFKDACREKGLLHDDAHWQYTMEEAERTRFPRAMRDLFVVLLVNCEINNPIDLWERFKGSMSEDFHHLEQRTLYDDTLLINGNHYNQALSYLQEKLGTFGKNLQQFNLPAPQNLHVHHVVNNREFLFEKQYNIDEQREIVEKNEPLLNPKQRNVYEFICDCLNRDIGKLIFIDAPGGTGKTFLNNLILAKVRSSGDIALSVASSGIAATLMPGGRTAHSRFKIPLNIKDNDLCNIARNSDTANLLINTKIIVWDECPMMRRESFEAVDRTLQDVLKNNAPFGGILTVCSGDFRQLLPVVKRGNDADVENACIKKSYLWRKFRKFDLKINMRVDEYGLMYSRFLLDVGEDKLQKNNNGEIELPKDMVLPFRRIEDSIDFIYPSFENSAELFSKNCVLVPVNESVRNINAICIRRFPGNMKEYCSFNSVCDGTNATHFPIEFLDSLEMSGLPPHKLELKKGSPIMMMRNLDPPRLCNGTRLIIEELHENLLVGKIITSAFKDEIVLIPRVKFILSENDGIPLQRMQFPVQSCFAMTIHKAQGQTMDNVLIYLEKPVFQHGQLYVALSRGRRKENVKVFLKNAPFAKNIVNTNVLR